VGIRQLGYAILFVIGYFILTIIVEDGFGGIGGCGGHALDLRQSAIKNAMMNPIIIKIFVKHQRWKDIVIGMMLLGINIFIGMLDGPGIMAGAKMHMKHPAIVQGYLEKSVTAEDLIQFSWLLICLRNALQVYTVLVGYIS
jgi:hypothetical protein